MNMNRKELLQQYIDTNLEVPKEGLRRKVDQVFYDCMEMASFSVGSKKAICKEGSIDEYIKNNNDEDKFQKLLFQYIDSKGLKDSDNVQVGYKSVISDDIIAENGDEYVYLGKSSTYKFYLLKDVYYMRTIGATTLNRVTEFNYDSVAEYIEFLDYK